MSREWLLAQTTEFHRTKFVEFAQLELNTGGPDPHMAIVGNSGYEDLPWFIGLYVARYTVASAVAMYHSDGDWEHPEWLDAHGAGLPIRRERRAVYSLPKMIECLQGLHAFVHGSGISALLGASSYDEAWDLLKVPYFGRYAKIKFLEGLRRYANFPHTMPDIRPQGAWSPVLTLGLMNAPLPEGTPLERINEAAEEWLLHVQSQLSGHALDYFRFETLLCNYRQALEGKYPGRPHDTELKYWKKAEGYWGARLCEWLPFYDIRRRLFDRRVLGECNTWSSPREDLEITAVDHGYFWSDLKYDYEASRNDLAHPVEWS